MYDDEAVHLASFKGDSADAIRGAIRVAINRGDYGTGDWFQVRPGEYEFRLNNVGISLREEASRRREERITVVNDGRRQPTPPEYSGQGEACVLSTQRRGLRMITGPPNSQGIFVA